MVKALDGVSSLAIDISRRRYIPWRSPCIEWPLHCLGPPETRFYHHYPAVAGCLYLAMRALEYVRGMIVDPFDWLDIEPRENRKPTM